jgi:hypothetical protein
MNSIKRIAATILFAGTLFGATATAPPAKAATGNTSIILAGHGYIATGTMSAGVFKQNQYFYGGVFTHAAVSSDTAMLYNTNTGAVATGYFTNGWFTIQNRYNIPSGFTHLVASCDTFLTYRRGTAYGMTGTLKNGTLAVKHYVNGFHSDWQHITASCDTVLFYAATNIGNTGVRALGYLRFGYFQQTSQYNSGFEWVTNMTSTSDSWLQYYNAPGNSFGRWGALKYGGDTASDYNNYMHNNYQRSSDNILAGTSDTVVFYNKSNGAAATSTLVNGNYTYKGSMQWGVGWQVIAGGK